MAVRGLLFDVENPYEASTQTLAEAGRTMSAQTKASKVTTKEETTVGDILNTGMAVAAGITAFKSGAETAAANERLKNLKAEKAQRAQAAAEAAPTQFKEVGTKAQAASEATQTQPKGMPKVDKPISEWTEEEIDKAMEKANIKRGYAPEETYWRLTKMMGRYYG